MTINPAFDLLRKYKPCDENTEELVMKKVRGRVSQDELITIFEKGVSGEYGKFIYADPQTLNGWITKYRAGKNSVKNYLATGLIDKNLHITHPDYPCTTNDWYKEVNKAYTAFLNGVSETNFHPHIYDRMMLDRKFPINSYLEYFEPTGVEDLDVMKAKQKVIRNFFNDCKKKSFSFIYVIFEKTKTD